jgi:hypothetical protein
MELNSKKLERTSKIVYYSISVILCIFLILLSNRIIDDLDTATVRPEVTSFENKSVLPELQEKVEALNLELEKANSGETVIRQTMSTARENYTNEKQSFDNWVQTRKTLGSPDKDQEVVDRARRLDEFYKVEQDWRTQLNAKQAEIEGIRKKQDEIRDLVDTENALAEEKFSTELKSYELKVFLIRLLFVGPILCLGIFFFVRYRRHKFWPLFFGFTLFSFYAFFLGLVPYLPSYGGYVRYAVGILMSVGLGYYAIKTIRQYLETKQAELQISTQERAKNVQSQVAEKAHENHFCPSCGKDFMFKKWEMPAHLNESDSYKYVTDFCRYCGLELFVNCKKCNHKNFAHLPFCAACGTKPLP